MMQPDPWEINVDPARELKETFLPAAIGVTVWKIGGPALESINQYRAEAEQAVKDMKDTASAFNAQLIFSDMQGYGFYFKQDHKLPEGWERATRSDGMPIIDPSNEIAYKMRTLNDSIRHPKYLSSIEALIKQQIRSSINTADMDQNGIWKIEREIYALKARSMEKINGDFYVIMDASPFDVPGCEKIKMSDYYRLKEDLNPKEPQPEKVTSTIATKSPSVS